MQISRTLKEKAKAFLGFSAPTQHKVVGPKPLLVVVFLRGGADGLSLATPYGDDGYYRNRLLTSLNRPTSGSKDRLIDLDGFYGLHPSLEPLYPYYASGQFAIVHACGSGDTTLSHFAASSTVERGLFGGQGDSTGWLARYLNNVPQTGSEPIKAVSIGSVLPASLDGASCATAIQSVADLLVDYPFAKGREIFHRDLLAMYGQADVLSSAGRSTMALIESVSRIPRLSKNGAAHFKTDNLSQGLREISELIRCDSGLSVACIDQSGYDTHVVQGGSVGILSSCLTDLANGISSFITDLDPGQWRQTKIVVMSEFGRRVRENDGGGTDHGHGSAMFVLGGSGVNGGKVFGTWPGLNDKGLDDNGNLRVTTDYRSVLSEIVTNQLGPSASNMIFPNLKAQAIGVVDA